MRKRVEEELEYILIEVTGAKHDDGRQPLASGILTTILAIEYHDTSLEHWSKYFLRSSLSFASVLPRVIRLGNRGKRPRRLVPTQALTLPAFEKLLFVYNLGKHAEDEVGITCALLRSTYLTLLLSLTAV